MKKICSLLLILCLIFLLSACKSDNVTSDDNFSVFCAECGEEVSPTDKFCSSCGAPVNKQNNTTDDGTENNNSANDIDVPASTSSTPTTNSKTETYTPSTTTPSTTTKPETTKPTNPTHTHNYSKATCTEPEKCSCGATNGSALGHSYNDATCTETKKCSRCGATDGDALGHSYSKAACTEAKKCARCGATDGSALGHNWQDATCKAPKTCSVCKATEGSPIEHVLYGTTCKWCKQPIVVSPKNLDKTKTYVHITKVDDFETDQYVFTDVITVDSIGFSEWLHIGNQGLFSSKIYNFTNKDEKINYNGKDYYAIGIGGVGIGITYEITEKEIIICDEYNPNEYAVLNLLSDGSIKVISKTNNFKGDWETQIGWIYNPTQTFF